MDNIVFIPMHWEYDEAEKVWRWTGGYVAELPPSNIESNIYEGILKYHSDAS